MDYPWGSVGASRVYNGDDPSRYLDIEVDLDGNADLTQVGDYVKGDVVPKGGLGAIHAMAAGCKCDDDGAGNGHDDTARVQAAWDTLHAAGGGVYYTGIGFSKITADLTYYPDVVVEGVLCTLSGFNYYSNGVLLESINASTVNHGRIERVGLINCGTGTHALSLEAVGFLRVEECHVAGNGTATPWLTAGIELTGGDGSYNNTFARNDFEVCEVAIIFNGPNCTENKVVEGRVHNCHYGIRPTAGAEYTQEKVNFARMTSTYDSAARDGSALDLRTSTGNIISRGCRYEMMEAVYLTAAPPTGKVYATGELPALNPGTNVDHIGFDGTNDTWEGIVYLPGDADDDAVLHASMQVGDGSQNGNLRVRGPNGDFQVHVIDSDSAMIKISDPVGGTNYLWLSRDGTTWNFKTMTQLQLGGTKVLGTQGAAVADVVTGGSATAATNAAGINLILARMRAHGLIAT